MIKELLLIIQAISAVVLGVSILLQRQGGGMGVLGGDHMTSFHTRRGVEKFIFITTIVSAVALFGTLIVRFFLI